MRKHLIITSVLLLACGSVLFAREKSEPEMEKRFQVDNLAQELPVYIQPFEAFHLEALNDAVVLKIQGHPHLHQPSLFATHAGYPAQVVARARAPGNRLNQVYN